MLKLKHIESATVALLLLFAAVHTLAQYEDGQPGDFGESLAYSAVNLNAAHGGDDDAQDEQQRLESLLHWSISNSDPQALRDAAVEATKREAVQDLLEQRKRVRELLDYMNAQPTETDMLKEAIGLVSDLSKSDAVRLHALKAMQVGYIAPLPSSPALTYIDCRINGYCQVLASAT